MKQLHDDALMNTYSEDVNPSRGTDAVTLRGLSVLTKFRASRVFVLALRAPEAACDWPRAAGLRAHWWKQEGAGQ